MKAIDFLKKVQKSKEPDDVKMHIEDWVLNNFILNTEVKELDDLSMKEALDNANLWMLDLGDSEKIELGEVEEILDFGEMKLILLIDQKSFGWEGFHMKHCVKSYYKKSEEGLSKVYSLRKKDYDIPVCTFEIENEKLIQVHGRGNGKVSPKYFDTIITCLSHLKVSASRYVEKMGYLILTPYIKKQLMYYFSGITIRNIQEIEVIYVLSEVKFKKHINIQDNRLGKFIFYIISKQPNMNLFMDL